MSKKNIMRRFKIEEISGVDRPAQKGAKALIMKRDSQELEKSVKAALTTEYEGHTHLVPLEFPYTEGEVERSGMTSYANDHTHPWVLTDSGDIVIGMENGHTHEIDVIGKHDDEDLEKAGYRGYISAEERRQLADEGVALPNGSYPIANAKDLVNAIRSFGRANEGDRAKIARHIQRRARALGLTDKLPEEGVLAGYLSKSQTEVTDMETKVQELQEKLSKALQLAEMTDAQKAHYATLEDEVAETFLQKSAEDKEAELVAVKKAASDTDPVVYTTSDGHQLRKSAGEMLISLAKSADAAKKENAELKKAQRQGELKKRAEDELPHLPGTVEVRAALLEAIDGITCEETRKSAGELLKAHNESLSGAYHTYGVEGGAQKDESAEQQLAAMAKAYAKEHKVTEAAAYVAVTTTPEGSALYAKAVG